MSQLIVPLRLVNQKPKHIPEAKQLLEKIPLLGIKIQIATNSQPDQAVEIVAEMIGYLKLSANAGFKTVPSEVADQAWHEFILFTREYHTYCVKHFGSYLHHSPGLDADTEVRYQKTLELVGANQMYWPTTKTGTNCGCDGGNTIASCGCDGGNT